MRRGRKRKPNPSIPRHIQQDALPRGLYWHVRRYWYVFEETAEGARTHVTVAGPEASMSELHRIMELRAGHDRDSLAWLFEQYEASPQFKRLKPTTRASYEKSRAVIADWPRKSGGRVGDFAAKTITRAFVQRLVDQIAAGNKRNADGELIPTPTKAKHALSYFSVALRWGANRGHVSSNVAEGVEAPQQVGKHNMPSEAAFAAVIQHARINAYDGRGGVRGKAGTCPSYLWAAAMLVYRCRLRGIEVTTLTDANALPEGLLSNRRKGSRDNITAWTPDMRDAWQALVARRTKIWHARSFPVPLRADQRPLIVTVTGDPITKSGFDSAWQRMMTEAVRAGAIAEADRFSLHGLKHRGVTDTAGTRAEKQEASGHRSERMMNRYDHSVPVVPAAGSSDQSK